VTFCSRRNGFAIAQRWLCSRRRATDKGFVMVLWASEGGFAVVHPWFCSRPPVVMQSSFNGVLLVIETGGRPKGGSVVVCDNLPCNGTHCMSKNNEFIHFLQFQKQ
jgi:hypothetical protein